MGEGISFRKKFLAFGGSRWINDCFPGFATFFVDFVDSPSDDIYFGVFIQKTDLFSMRSGNEISSASIRAMYS